MITLPYLALEAYPAFRAEPRMVAIPCGTYRLPELAKKLSTAEIQVDCPPRFENRAALVAFGKAEWDDVRTALETGLDLSIRKSRTPGHYEFAEADPSGVRASWRRKVTSALTARYQNRLRIVESYVRRVPDPDDPVYIADQTRTSRTVSQAMAGKIPDVKAFVDAECFTVAEIVRGRKLAELGLRVSSRYATNFDPLNPKTAWARLRIDAQDLQLILSVSRGGAAVDPRAVEAWQGVQLGRSAYDVTLAAGGGCAFPNRPPAPLSAPVAVGLSDWTSMLQLPVHPKGIETLTELLFGRFGEAGGKPGLLGVEAHAAYERDKAQTKLAIETPQTAKTAPIPASSTTQSQAFEAWAKATGSDLVMELVPCTDAPFRATGSASFREILAAGDAWVVKRVHGAYVLCDALRFLDEAFRYPVAALVALERTNPPAGTPGREFSQELSPGQADAYYGALAPDAPSWSGRRVPPLTEYRGHALGQLDNGLLPYLVLSEAGGKKLAALSASGTLAKGFPLSSVSDSTIGKSAQYMANAGSSVQSLVSWFPAYLREMTLASSAEGSAASFNIYPAKDETITLQETCFLRLSVPARNAQGVGR